MIIINFSTLISYLTPPTLNVEPFKQFLNAALKPLNTLHDFFQLYVNKAAYEMAFTGQVIYLEKLLNDKFNDGGTEIYITDRVISSRLYLYNKIEDKPPVYLHNQSEGADPLYLYNDAEYQLGFVIHVPSGLVTNWNEFKWWVNKYKLKSKEYTIIEY